AAQLAAAAGSALLGATLGWAALQPDTYFLRQMGDSAVARHDPDGIIIYYEPLARAGSDRPSVYENLALAYLARGRRHDARGGLDRAIALWPTFEAHVLAARTYLDLGDRARARDQLRSARKLADTAERRSDLAQIEDAVERSGGR